MEFLDTAIQSIGGDPDRPACNECGQPWRPEVADARAAVAAAPAAYRALLESGDPYRVADGLTWHGAAYTWHAADVCRAWAERIAGFVGEPERGLAGFDQDELAAARGYLDMSAIAAVWALEASAELLLGLADDTVVEQRFDHPEWGAGSFGDALRWVAHDLVHHEADVQRSVA